MNPFLKHDILRELPYELMKSPDKEKIQRFVSIKKKQRLNMARLVMGFGVLGIVANLSFFEYHWTNVLNLVLFAIWIFQGGWLGKQAQKIAIPETELDLVLREVAGSE